MVRVSFSELSLYICIYVLKLVAIKSATELMLSVENGSIFK